MIRIPILFYTDEAKEKIKNSIEFDKYDGTYIMEVWFNPSSIVVLHKCTDREEYTSIYTQDGEVYTCPLTLDRVKSFIEKKQ